MKRRRKKRQAVSTGSLPLRVTTTAQSGYHRGARNDINSMARWTPDQVSPDAAVGQDREDIRDRAEHMVCNDGICSGVVRHFKDHVVGEGVWPRPAVDRSLVRLNDNTVETFQDRAHALFRMWGSSKGCDAMGRDCWPDLEAKVLRACIVRGDAFAQKRMKDKTGWPFKLALMLIEGDRVASPSAFDKTPHQSNGISFDDDGQPKAYYILDDHPGNDTFMSQKKGRWHRARDPKTGEELIIPIIPTDRPGQSRGISIFAPIVETVRLLGRYITNEEVAAAVSSCFTVFITSEQGGLGELGDPLEDTPSSEPGNIDLGPGMINDLRPGESINQVNPTRPNAQFGPFVESVAKQIGVSTGIPYEALLMHFQSSYSAARAALLRAWVTFKTFRALLVRHFCQPVYEAFVAECVANGLLNAPGFFTDPLARYAWTRASWTGPTPGSIDPLKEVNAAVVRMNEGLTTLAQETEQMSGRDWEDNQRQRAREKSLMEELGVRNQPVPIVQEKEKEEEEQDQEESKGDKQAA